MKKKFFNALVLAAALILTACGGGGGGGSSYSGGGDDVITYTHSELADEFVLRMFTDLGIDLSIVKTNTQQYDYIVVEDLDLYDPILGPFYTAYYIGDYMPGESLADYIAFYDDDFFYPLVDNYDGTYSGFDGFGNYATFDETDEAVKDLEKVQAMVEGIKVDRVAKKLAADFGLSEERSVKVAKIASSWKKLSAKRSMTDADADSFSEEILGVSISKVKDTMRAMSEGEQVDTNELIETAAEHNGISPENMNELVNEFFMK